MSKFDFNPKPYRKILKTIIQALAEGENYDKVLRRYPKTKASIFTKAEIIQALRYFGKPISLLGKPIRTLSGVVPVTLLTKPYPCPGKCIFCPNDVKMPKSYLSAEPGAQRAKANNFDPYNQVSSRLQSYYANGHSTDKVELIILGGTWSAYPLSYKIWFIYRCFEALNNFKPDRKLNLPQLSGESDWFRLFSAQKINETAACRCVGLSIETRPDFITISQLIELRKMGCTKIQIGIQSLSDKVLKLNHRGHTVSATKKAIKLLRQFGFKIQAHWMANLYGSTPKKDVADFKKLFSQKWYRPDELKIYPCSLLATAPLMKYYRLKLWRPYTDQELLSVMKAILPLVPAYCRVSRMIRDFSSNDIVIGNKTTNLRQIVETNLPRIQEIRSREIKDQVINPANLKLRIVTYPASASQEKFIQWVTPTNQICGFLRLSLPYKSNSAMIRELHVYGRSLNLKAKGKTQHLGLGSKLIQTAKTLSRQNKYQILSVISAVGTREYYRRHGFVDAELYQQFTID